MASRRPPRLHRDAYRGLQRYFLTISTINRKPHFADRSHAEIVIGELLRTATAYSFEVIAYCFMRDHIHGLFESTRADADFVKFVSMFKQRSAFKFKQLTGGLLWQDSFHDHVLRNDESTLGVAAYIISNPLRDGLCDDARTYPLMGSSRYTIEELLDAIQWRP